MVDATNFSIKIANCTKTYRLPVCENNSQNIWIAKTSQELTWNAQVELLFQELVWNGVAGFTSKTCLVITRLDLEVIRTRWITAGGCVLTNNLSVVFVPNLKMFIREVNVDYGVGIKTFQVTNWAGGLPPNDLHTNSTSWPLLSFSPLL